MFLCFLVSESMWFKFIIKLISCQMGGNSINIQRHNLFPSLVPVGARLIINVYIINRFGNND